MLSDIIAAVSTPRGTGGIAVIRISGSGAVQLAEKVFCPKSGKGILEYKPRFAIYGDICDDVSTVDSGILTYYLSPNSYTGEDMVEISCHGGYTVTAMVLSAVLEKGARMAEGGEFTRRAFVNNKIGLTEAEAVGNMLTAESQRAVRLSNRHINGALRKKTDEISEKLISLISSLYASIDYPEEDLEDMSDDDLLLDIRALREECVHLVSTYKSGHAVAHGINTVIVGKTNVGKSSFFNSLISEKKAIVTDIPGTTRDVLEQLVEIDGIALRVFDTAGIRDNTDDVIESMGIEIAKEKMQAEETELVLALFDSSRELDESDKNLLASLAALSKEKTVIPVFTKCDKEQKADKTEIEAALRKAFCISCVTEEGIAELKNEIIHRFLTCESDIESGAVITNIRQQTSLKKCIELLDKAESLVASGMKDMSLIELENAANTVGEIDSRTVAEKIVNEIFSKFCVGK
ncbi:MAG: tRNA uridine-5-carboxymethylaminomethyl(34) synthesis GTPase MnmE [Ruminococcaceae bacterium]|nr:tRNA uridine-5-carboxymethylaminomethyl(34) synthesis GTPase MnmE [Oscillospiraceae bacterium]